MIKIYIKTYLGHFVDKHNWYGVVQCCFTELQNREMCLQRFM